MSKLSWKTIVFNLYFIPLFAALTVVCFAAFPAAYVLMWLRLRRPRMVILWCIRTYGRLAMLAAWPFLRLRFESRQRASGQLAGRPRGQWRPGVYVLNHGSWSDAFFVAMFPFYNGAFALRSWVFKVWIYAPFMIWGGYLDAEKTSWKDLLEQCRRRLEEGVSIMFFPEGHRTRDGRLQRFHGPAFHIACALGLDVTPVCLHGTYDFLGHHRLLARPATVTMRFLPPISPADFPEEGRTLAMKRKAREEMERNLEEMARS